MESLAKGAMDSFDTLNLSLEGAEKGCDFLSNPLDKKPLYVNLPPKRHLDTSQASSPISPSITDNVESRSDQKLPFIIIPPIDNDLRPVLDSRKTTFERQPTSHDQREFACRVELSLLNSSRGPSGVISPKQLQGVALVREESVCFGGFADIYLASWGGRVVALKKPRTTQNDFACRYIQQETALKEAVVWVPLNHPYILPLLGIETEIFPPCICLVTPWMNHGTLKDVVSAERLSTEDVQELLFKIAQGVAYLHSIGIIHGDIRGVNILIDDGGHPRLTDFGLSILEEAEIPDFTLNHQGSIRWMAPELLDPESFGVRFQRTRATDVYAFGCVCMEVYTHQHPFLDIHNEWAVIQKVMQGVHPPRPSKPAPLEMSDGIWQLVESCLAQRAAERPTMTTVAEVMEAESSSVH